VINSERCIVIGGSTAAPRSIFEIISKIDEAMEDSPPIIIVQHISSSFVDTFAGQVRSYSGKRDVSIVRDGTLLNRGGIYIVGKTDASKVMSLCNKKGYCEFKIIAANQSYPPVRPSIDEMFISASRCLRRTILILLSGIGTDGTIGISVAARKYRKSILIQDPSETVANGMLISASSLGIGDTVPLSEIKRRLIGMLGR